MNIKIAHNKFKYKKMMCPKCNILLDTYDLKAILKKHCNLCDLEKILCIDQNNSYIGTSAKFKIDGNYFDSTKSDNYFSKIKIYFYNNNKYSGYLSLDILDKKIKSFDQLYKFVENFSKNLIFV